MALTHGDPDASLQTTDDSEKSAPDDAVRDNGREYPSGIARILILGPVTLTYFVFFLDLAVVSTAAPAITSTFNSLLDVGWYGTRVAKSYSPYVRLLTATHCRYGGAYQLGSSAFQPLTGKIFRYFSIKVSARRREKEG